MSVEVDNKEIEMDVLKSLLDRFNKLISILDLLGKEDKRFNNEFVKSIFLQDEQQMDNVS